MLEKFWLIRNKVIYKYSFDILILKNQEKYKTTVQLRIRKISRKPIFFINSKSAFRNKNNSDKEYLTKISNIDSIEKNNSKPKTLLSLVDKIEFFDILKYFENKLTIASKKMLKNE